MARFGAVVLFDSEATDCTSEATREFDTVEDLLPELRDLMLGPAPWRLVTICRAEDLPALMADAEPRTDDPPRA